MTERDAGLVMAYYAQIPYQMRQLRDEREELEARYDPRGAARLDGMPSGQEASRPAETMGMLLAERDTQERLETINKTLEILAGDRDAVQGCLDGIRGRYNYILWSRYIRGDSWVSISMHLTAAESTTRYWHGRALRALARALDERPRAGLLERSKRARV